MRQVIRFSTQWCGLASASTGGGLQRGTLGAVARQAIERPDMIVIAGGARTLASPRNDFERDFILEQFRMSIQLHKTIKAYLMSHSDCATYGGLAAFGNDREVEAKHHQQELKRAAELLRADFPELSVECFFVTFDGINAVKLSVVEQVA